MEFKKSLLYVAVLSGLFINAGCSSTQNASSNASRTDAGLIDMGLNVPVDFKDMKLTRFVNPFIGTGNLGNTYPGATTPHGMVQLSPNNGASGWEYTSGYYYNDNRIAGFSHTHLSGAGAGDLNDILVMPINSRSDYMLNKGAAQLNLEASRFKHKNEQATAGYYSVLLDDYDIKAELTASDRVGIHRYSFPQDARSEIVVNLGFNVNWDYSAKSHFVWDEKTNTLSGYRYSDGWAASQKEFFVMTFDKKVKNIRFEYFDTKTKSYVKAEKGLTTLTEQYARAYVEFDTQNTPLIVEAKVALSNTEIGKKAKSGASLNMTEVANKNFDDVRRETTAKWENALAKLQVEGDIDYKQTFYSALYHSLLGQTIHSDLDGRYRQVLQGRGAYPDGSNVDGDLVSEPLIEKVRLADANKDAKADFIRYDTFSLWDTYRSVQPLSSIIEQDKLADMVLSMLSYADETWVDHNGKTRQGRLPEWTFKGNETGMMMGMHSTSIIADVLNKKLLDKRMTELNFTQAQQDDIKARLISSMIKDARQGSAVDSIDEYSKNGFKASKMRIGKGDLWAHSPFDTSWTASYSLEYAYNDWSIAQAIKNVLGEDAPEYKEFANRSNNWMAQFDFGGKKYKGWFKARDNKGEFIDADWVDPATGLAVGKDWRPDMFNYAFAESNGWQYSFSVQHDIHGLIDHLTTFDKTQHPNAKRGELFTKRLDEYWSTYPDRNAGDNQFPVFNTGNVGQHVQGNEPDHHVPYLYNYVAQPWKTQAVIAAATKVCYNNTPNGICGNDDFGTMSSWFVFRALGFYPVNAASGVYEIGTPMFNNAKIDVGEDEIFEVIAQNVSRENIYIQSARLNGKELDRSYLTHQEIMAGGELEFVMGEFPNKTWASTSNSTPPDFGIGQFLHQDKMPKPVI